VPRSGEDRAGHTWEITMPRLLSEEMLEPAASASARPEPERPASPNPLSGAARRPDGPGAMSLHISKLRGITDPVRGKLKRRGITYTHQLVEAAARAADRRALAASSGIDVATLERLVCRADLVRIKGIGAIFADLLELLGVDRVERLARKEPHALHAALAGLNAVERLARRAPTQEEVEDWIAQARALPPLIEDEIRLG
jgi:predicted flap endonuclease-1-like 5' DNA nuclease